MTAGESQGRGTPSVTAVADRLHSAAVHLLRRVRKQDIQTGIGPAQLSALSVLVFAGPLTLKVLAAAEQVKPPTMSRIVVGLERQGLARRRVDLRDRRALRLYATPKGIRILQLGRRRRILYLAARLRPLKARDLATLNRAAYLLERLFHRAR